MLGLQNEREWVSVLRQGAAAARARQGPALHRQLQARGRARRAARDHRRSIRVPDRRAGGRAARRCADRQCAGQHHARGLGAPAVEGARPLARGRHARGPVPALLPPGSWDDGPAHGPRACTGRAHRCDPGRARLRRRQRSPRCAPPRPSEVAMPRSIRSTYLFVPGDAARTLREGAGERRGRA